MLGDRPSAEIEAPENVLFVCKLNPFTNDEDLELIFSRFDQEAKAEIIRDPDTGASLQYAFVEFKSNEAANEAYLKMNNALVDDRRIRVDFSQSVSNVWDRFNKKYRRGDKSAGIDRGFMDNGGSGRGRGRGGGRGRGNWGRGRGSGRGHHLGPRHQSSAYRSDSHHQQQQHQSSSRYNGRERKEPGFDNFDRGVKDTNPSHHSKSHNDEEERQNPHLRRSRSRSRSRDDDSREDRRRRKHSRRSRSRSDSSDYSRRKRKKCHKHRKKDSSRHRKRSRSHDRERKHKHKKHRHRRRDEDDERRHEHHRHDRSRSR